MRKQIKSSYSCHFCTAKNSLKLKQFLVLNDMPQEFTTRDCVRFFLLSEHSDNYQVRPDCLKKENTSMKNLRPKSYSDNESLKMCVDHKFKLYLKFEISVFKGQNTLNYV